MKILSDAEDIKDIPSLEIVQNLISKVVAKTVPCDNEVITENYKLGTNVQTALSNLLTYTYVNASGISQLSTGLQSAWNAINAIPTYTGGSGIVVSGSVIGHSNNLTAEGTVNTGEIQSPDFGENATLTWFRYDKQGHVTFTGSGGIKIPTADTTLSSTSTRPISSKAVYDNLKASVIRATTKTVGSGSGAVSIYDDVQETLEGFQSHIYKLHTDVTSLSSAVGVLNTYKDSINISAGSKTVPVYFNNGVPTVCQYTLGSMCKESADDYLPIKGGTLTGKLTVNSDICIPTAKAVADNSVPLAGSNLTITNADFTQLKKYKSFIGGVHDDTNNIWYNAINVRHRNGYNDGSNYGMYIHTKLTSSGDLIWNKQTAASKWQGERTIVDSGNYTTYFKNSASNIAGTGLEYVDYIDSSGKNITKINHKKGSMSGTIGPDPVTYTPNFGETFDVGYAQYDDTGHIILSSTATIKLPKYTSLKNPFALTIQGNGTTLVTYDGAGPVTLNITPSTIGAAIGTVFTGGGTSGTKGYVAFAQLKVTAIYSNKPIEFKLTRRGSDTPCYVSARFANVNSTDPTLESLTVFGTGYGVFAHKTGTSTWLLYATKSEAYDSINVVGQTAGHTGITITYPGTFITSKPTSDIVSSTYGYVCGSATKWLTARNINGMSVDGSANRVNYGTCSIAGQTKTVDCPGFVLVTGAEITVKFTTPNISYEPTLNVNGTGDIPIYYKGSTFDTPSYLAKNGTYTFRYNGTQYDLVGDLDITDVNVAQRNTTSNSDRRLLLSSHASDSDNTSNVYKSSKLTFNPSTGELKKTGDSPINSSYGMQLCSMYADEVNKNKQITMTYEQFSKHNLLLWTLLKDDSYLYHEGIIPVKYLISHGSWTVYDSNGTQRVKFTVSNSKVYFQTYSSEVNLKIYSLI